MDLSFSTRETAWRTRIDRKVLSVTNRPLDAVYPPFLARYFAFLYVLSVAFKDKPQIWHKDLLQYMGADLENKRDMINGRIMVQRYMLALDACFNVKVERHNVKAAEQEGKGRWVYQITSWGVFNSFSLQKMLVDNAPMFENIARNLVKLASSEKSSEVENK